MRGYGDASYGDGMADVYDDWYTTRFDTDAAVAVLHELAGAGPVLELGAGTGRLAIPLAAAGHEVHALDASQAMLDQLTAKKGAEPVVVHLGDMTSALPEGPFTMAFVAVNTLFNVTSDGGHRRVFHEVASRLARGGRFVIEAFVPDLDRNTSAVEVRDIAIDRVVLVVSRSDPSSQRAEGQHVELVDGAPVRLRPWSIRWSTPAQLDEMAAACGMVLEARWASWQREPFGPHSDNHVTIYRMD